jgi:hypothetical protein
MFIETEPRKSYSDYFCGYVCFIGIINLHQIVFVMGIQQSLNLLCIRGEGYNGRIAAKYSNS